MLCHILEQKQNLDLKKNIYILFFFVFFQFAVIIHLLFSFLNRIQFLVFSAEKEILS